MVSHCIGVFVRILQYFSKVACPSDANDNSCASFSAMGVKASDQCLGGPGFFESAEISSHGSLRGLKMAPSFDDPQSTEGGLSQEVFFSRQSYETENAGSSGDEVSAA